MKRFKITLLVPHIELIEAYDIQSAHREATKLVHAGRDPAADNDNSIAVPRVHSIEFLEEVQSEFDDFPPKAS